MLILIMVTHFDIIIDTQEICLTTVILLRHCENNHTRDLPQDRITPPLRKQPHDGTILEM